MPARPPQVPSATRRAIELAGLLSPNVPASPGCLQIDLDCSPKQLHRAVTALLELGVRLCWNAEGYTVDRSDWQQCQTIGELAGT